MPKRNVTVSTKNLVLTALLTAIVVVLHLVSTLVPPIGPLQLQLNLVLIPVVVGAAILGPLHAAWLGLVSAIAILLTPSTAFFYGINVLGTILTVIVKGTLSGLAAGYVYKLLSRFNVTLAVTVAAVVCPIVNTGIFVLGCFAFFWPTIVELANGSNAIYYLFFSFIGVNFLVELGSNVILSPVVTTLINAKKRIDA